MVCVLRVCVWDVRLVFWCCGVLCCVVMCGVGGGVSVQCVVCGVYGVCAWCCVVVVLLLCCLCVARLGTRKKVCRFKTPPCVPAKRPHVFNMRAFCQYTRKRFDPPHGDVLNYTR